MGAIKQIHFPVDKHKKIYVFQKQYKNKTKPNPVYDIRLPAHVSGLLSFNDMVQTVPVLMQKLGGGQTVKEEQRGVRQVRREAGGGEGRERGRGYLWRGSESGGTCGCRSSGG